MNLKRCLNWNLIGFSGSDFPSNEYPSRDIEQSVEEKSVEIRIPQFSEVMVGNDTQRNSVNTVISNTTNQNNITMLENFKKKRIHNLIENTPLGAVAPRRSFRFEDAVANTSPQQSHQSIELPILASLDKTLLNTPENSRNLESSFTELGSPSVPKTNPVIFDVDELREFQIYKKNSNFTNILKPGESLALNTKKKSLRVIITNYTKNKKGKSIFKVNRMDSSGKELMGSDQNLPP